MQLPIENRGVALSTPPRSRRFMVMMAAFSVVLMIFAVVMMATAVPQADAAKQCNNAHAQILKIGIKKARTAFYCLLNEERKVAGLGAVESDSRIELAAQRHSKDMVKRDYFSHAAPSPAPYGRFPTDRIKAAGWPYDGVGASETIGGGPTPHWVLSSWLLSRSHCQILMYPGVDYMGFGWYQGTATLDVVSDMRSGYVERYPACPRKMRTNAAPFVKVVKAKRKGKRLTIRLKTNVKQAVRVVTEQRVSNRVLKKHSRVRLNARPKTIRIRLPRATGGFVTFSGLGIGFFD